MELGNRTKEAVSERDRLIDDLKTSQRLRDTKILDLTKTVKEQETVVDDQKAELIQRIEICNKLDASLRERD